jgi:hypothetical protein
LYRFIPFGRFIKEEHDVLSIILLELLLNRVVRVGRLPHELPVLLVYVRQQDLHPAGTFGAQQVRFILHHALLRAHLVFNLGLAGVQAIIVDVEFSS